MKKLMLLVSLLAVLAFLATGIGATYISPAELIRTIGNPQDPNSVILGEYRLPRVLLGILSGAGLAVSGTVLQSVIRNPLASPDVVGVSKGAGLMAVMVIILFPYSPAWLLPVSAFAGAAIVAAMLVLLARKGGTGPSLLALSGLAIGAICQALTDYLLVKHPMEANDTLAWLAGSLWAKGWDDIHAILPWLAVLLPCCYALQRELDILHLDEDSTSSLGMPLIRIRMLLISVAVALAGVCVASIGTIGFIGLLAPHLARRIVGGAHHLLLPGAAITGALVLVAADALGRGLRPPLEIPAGIVTAIIGAPYFLYLLLRRQSAS